MHDQSCWAGAPAALLRSVRRLREVFEVCGRDPDGFLRVERVAALGLRFGQGEEVRAPRRGRPRPSPPTPGFLALSPARSQSPAAAAAAARRHPAGPEDFEPRGFPTLSDPRFPPFAQVL